MKNLLGTAVVMLMVASSAEATPITVSAGDSVLFNFDLTGVTPPPPYSFALLSTELSDLDFFPPDVGLWTFWTELDGTGTTFASGDATLNAIANFAEMNDGVFSASLSMTAGSITVDPCVIATTDGTDWAVLGAQCNQYVPPVPEPSTLSLLAGGIAAVALLRCGRRIRTGGLAASIRFNG